MIRVFPKKTKWIPTDELAFVGDPPLFRPKEDLPVRISCVFTWHIEEAERLRRSWERFYSDVQVGGPAYNDKGGDFTPGIFVKHGIIHTSRGCSKDCPWCFVPKREGGIKEIPIHPGWNINDNNLLACSKTHIENVFKMLKSQKEPIVFSGGLDAELFNSDHADLLKSIKLGEAWFACDYHGAIEHLEKVAALLSDISPRKKRCYVLIGYAGESLSQAESRLISVYKLGFWPFAMLFKGGDSLSRKGGWSKEWLALQRTWCRPAAFKSAMKNRG